MKQPTILLALFVAVSYTAYSQTKLDSLKTVIQTADHDTTKAKALLNLSGQLYFSNPDTAIQIAQQALHIYKKKHIEKGIASAYNHLGAFHYIKSDYPTALDYYHKSLEIRVSLNDKKGIAASYNNIGTIYERQSSYPQALGYYLKSLKIYKEMGNKKYIASCYNNIGTIYRNQSSYPQALGYYFKSIKIKRELNDTLNTHFANTYNNIGIIYKNQSSYSQALVYYFKALKIYKELGEKSTALANTYNNIGTIYYNQSFYPQALGYYFKSLKIQKQLGNKRGMAHSYTNIGSLYTALYTQSDSLERVGGWAVENPGQLLDTALYFQFKAIELEKELSDEWSMSQTLNAIGETYTI